MTLSDADVRRVAALVRIAMDDDEVEPIAGELSRILDWIETLGEVDVTGVKPMTGVLDMNLRERDDIVDDGGMPEAILSNAPEAEDDHFVVPRVVE